MTRPEAAGLRLLAFYTEDIEKDVKELKEKGISVEPIRLDALQERKTFFADQTGFLWSAMNREVNFFLAKYALFAVS